MLCFPPPNLSPQEDTPIQTLSTLSASGSFPPSAILASCFENGTAPVYLKTTIVVFLLYKIISFLYPLGDCESLSCWYQYKCHHYSVTVL